MSDRPPDPAPVPDTEPAPAPSAPSSIGGIPLQIIVKGGTTSSAYDKVRQEAKVIAEKGRAQMEKQERSVAMGDGMTEHGFVASRLHSLRMMDKGTPRLVFYYLNRDKTVRQECVGELVMTPDGDSLFVLVCPKCLERGESHGSAQMMVRQSHRKFSLDTRKEGRIEWLRDPDGVPFQVKICGTIWCDEILKCMNFGCTWSVKIEDSKVMEV